MTKLWSHKFRMKWDNGISYEFINSNYKPLKPDRIEWIEIAEDGDRK